MEKLLIRILNSIDLVTDFYYDCRYNIKTTIGVEKYDLLPEETVHLTSAKKYQGARTRIIRKSLKLLNQHIDFRDYHLIDLGSGKGRLALWAKLFDFHQFTGIEFSPRLHSIAKRNLETLGFGNAILEDVTKFHYPQEKTIYFMFNPFDGVVLKKLLTKFKSLNSEHYLIYINPILDYQFQLQGYDLIESYQESNSNNNINIYKL